MSRPTLPNSPNKAPWPPEDGPSFVRSDRFGTLVIEIARSLTERYRTMDFTDAAARVFAWFDQRLAADRDFISEARFPSLSSFRAYVRQAIWNDARRAARAERSRQRAELRHRQQATEKRAVLPEEAGALAEQLDRLPEPHRSVTTGLLLTGQEVGDVAGALGLSITEVQQIYEAAIDMLQQSGGVAPRRTEAGTSPPEAPPAGAPGDRSGRNEVLLIQYESLPYTYREAFQEVFCENRNLAEVADAQGIPVGELYSRFEVALDLFCLHDVIGDGAELVILSDDHRLVARCMYLENMTPIEIAQAMGRSAAQVHQIINEIRRFLIPGALNLFRALAMLDDLHRAVFSRIFFEGEPPDSVASDLHVSAAQLKRIWAEAIHRMFETSSP